MYNSRMAFRTIFAEDCYNELGNNGCTYVVEEPWVILIFIQ